MANPKKRKDGRYVKRVPIGVDEKNKTKYLTVYATTIKELNNKAKEIELKYENISNFNLSQMTFGEWVEIYLKNYTTGLRPQSVRRYTAALKSLNILYPIKLVDLTNIHIQNFVNDFDVHQGIKKIIQVLNTALNVAYKLGYIKHNPVDRVIIPKNPKQVKNDLSDIENLAFLEALQNAKIKPHHKIIFYVLYYTGLRVNEALALSPADIDLDNNIISINKTLVKSTGHTICQNVTKNAAGMREIPIPNILVEKLQIYFDNYPPVEDKAFHINGEYIKRDSFDYTIHKIVYKYMKEHYPNDNIRDFTLHTLRHNYATNMVYMGINVKTIQRIIGHSSLDMTLVEYARSRDDNDIVTKVMNSVW